LRKALVKSSVSLRELLNLYFRIGNTTFGGGDPTIAALQRELIESKHWIDHDRFAVAYSLARITPGTNLLAFCAATGAQIRGWPGAIVAVLALTLPSAMLAVLLSAAYGTWMNEPRVIAVASGIVAAAIGLMWAGILIVVRPYFVSARRIRSALFFSAAFLCTWKLGLTPIQMLGLAALAGALWPERNAE
jgi:chromate transporter